MVSIVTRDSDLPITHLLAFKSAMFQARALSAKLEESDSGNHPVVVFVSGLQAVIGAWESLLSSAAGGLPSVTDFLGPILQQCHISSRGSISLIGLGTVSNLDHLDLLDSMFDSRNTSVFESAELLNMQSEQPIVVPRHQPSRELKSLSIEAASSLSAHNFAGTFSTITEAFDRWSALTTTNLDPKSLAKSTSHRASQTISIASSFGRSSLSALSLSHPLHRHFALCVSSLLEIGQHQKRMMEQRRSLGFPPLAEDHSDPPLTQSSAHFAMFAEQDVQLFNRLQSTDWARYPQILQLWLTSWLPTPLPVVMLMLTAASRPWFTRIPQGRVLEFRALLISHIIDHHADELERLTARLTSADEIQDKQQRMIDLVDERAIVQLIEMRR